MANSSNQSLQIQNWLDRLQAGDASARDELINAACERLTKLTRKMLHGNPRLKRWEQTDDVFQNSAVRLYRSLSDIHPTSVNEFFRLAALHIRRELIDLAKHYYGPHGMGANYSSVATANGNESASQNPLAPAVDDDQVRLAAWTEFHAQVDRLPDEEREVFDLLWYQEMPQAEAAALLNISERTIKRRWRSARLRLHEAINGEIPGD
jgi:RNA polymerase sigma factor (sigma-70 family)